MYKKVSIILFLFLLSWGLKGQNNPVRLSETAKISILTCAPGQELYSVFGHSAIRVSDPENQIDLAFNYGTFDFNTPFFYLKFGHGSLDYLLSVSSFKRFMREYFVEGRSVWEQELLLTPQQKQNLFEALIINAQPENRAYKYDFFYDNCATRVADMIVRQLPDRVNFSAHIPPKELTFREAIHPYLRSKPWTKLGIDLILGSPADAATDSMSVMFLPDYLLDQFAGIQYVSDTGRNVDLVEDTELILDFTDKNLVDSIQISPLVILWILAIVVFILSLGEHFGYVRKLKLIDIPLFLVAGIAGIVVAYLALISNHEVTSPNWNLLWINPIWLLFVTNVKNTFVNLLKKIQVLFIMIFLISIPFMKQVIPAEFIPLALVLLVRLSYPFSLITSGKNNR